MSMTVEEKANKAMEIAVRADQRVTFHEDLCAERYANLHHAIADLRAFLKWAGGTFFTVMIGVIGWLIAQQVTSSNVEQKALRMQIEQMQHELRENQSSPRSG